MTLNCYKGHKEGSQHIVFIHTQREYNSLHISNTTNSRRECDNLINNQIITNVNYIIIIMLSKQQQLNNYQTNVHVIKYVYCNHYKVFCQF